jgi:thiol-disulfide isomerase/thioredoxin
MALFLSLSQAQGATAPDFNLRTPEGKRVNLKELLEDGPVLLDFWATWCKPCIKAMPKLSSIHEDYGTRGLTVLGINEDGPRGQARVKPFVRSRKIPFPIALDPDGSVRSRMQVAALPTTVLVAQDGEIVLRQVGFSPDHDGQLRATLDTLLPTTEKE